MTAPKTGEVLSLPSTDLSRQPRARPSRLPLRRHTELLEELAHTDVEGFLIHNRFSDRQRQRNCRSPPSASTWEEHATAQRRRLAGDQHGDTRPDRNLTAAEITPGAGVRIGTNITPDGRWRRHRAGADGQLDLKAAGPSRCANGPRARSSLSGLLRSRRRGPREWSSPPAQIHVGGTSNAEHRIA
jgi:hypothetical protein